MLQVASSHYASTHSGSNHRGASYSAAPGSTSHHADGLQLPRKLSRPKFADVSLDAIVAAAPALSNVPPLYIRETLPSLIPSMLAGISSLASSHLPSTMPRSQVRSSMSIPLIPTNAQVEYPSHLLALSSSSIPKHGDAPVTLIPVHALVLASHCAHLPRLPSAAQQYSQTQLNLAVVQMSLPSPAAFSLLNTYMYTHRLDKFLTSLLPIPRGTSLQHRDIAALMSSNAGLHSLSLYLCSSSRGDMQTLLGHAGHVKEVWQDCVVLGLFDFQLWDAIDLAWEIVLGAMNIAAGAK